MQETSVSNRFLLSQADFTQEQGTGKWSIPLPPDRDYSFSLDGMLVVPDAVAHEETQTVFSFSAIPDTMYRLPLIEGEQGRSLPLQQLVLAESSLHVGIDLKRADPSPLPLREQPQEQNSDIPLPTDASCTEILVAGKTAYSTQPPSPPSLGMKVPKNNTPLQTVVAFFKMDERNAYDELTWAPPSHVQALIWRGSATYSEGNEICRYGSRLVRQSWNDMDGYASMYKNPVTSQWERTPVQVDGLGYQYAIGQDEGSPVMVYRNTTWDDSTEYACRIWLDGLDEEWMDGGAVPDKWYFKARYSTGTDSAGRILWRGWSPTVGFVRNAPPSPPSSLMLGDLNA